MENNQDFTNILMKQNKDSLINTILLHLQLEIKAVAEILTRSKISTISLQDKINQDIYPLSLQVKM